MRRRAYGSVLSSVGTNVPEVLEEDEVKFLQAVEIGDLPTCRAMLEDEGETISRLLRVSDYKDRTAIEMATENEHLDIVEYLVKNCSRTLDVHSVNESLMLAISKGYLRITQILLGHPMYQKSKDKFRLGSLTNYFQPKNNSKFDHDLTPIMLAAHVEEIDIIRVLLRRGDFVKKPHHTLCECTPCNNKRRFDPLKHSLAGIHAYRALASPAYISLTSQDPILTGFLLSKELMELAVIEKEFKNEYRELAKKCKNYVSELLHMCQNSDEVRTILNQEATSLDSCNKSTGEGTEDVFTSREPSDGVGEKNVDCSLARLKLAIKYRQKQFVAHPHIQHQLATMWYEHFPRWRQSSFFYKLFAVCLIPACLPFMALVYWIAPNSKVGMMVCTPLVKFITHTASYLIFLLLLFLESALMAKTDNTDQNNKFMLAIRGRNNCIEVFTDMYNDHKSNFELRFADLTPLEYIIVIYLVGMWWQEIKQIYEEGYEQYLASTWNWLDITMLNLYVSCFVLKMIGYQRAEGAIHFFIDNDDACVQVTVGDKEALQHRYYTHGDRRYWNEDDPTLVAEALFAMANVLSFSRMSYVLPVSEFLGPLQISLGKMLGDIIRFFVVFMVVFMAFFCALFNLYWGYEPRDIADNCPSKQGFGFATFEHTFLTLFWALFGLASPQDTKIPNGTDYGENGHQITETIGTMLFMVYHVVMALVMLNMLIAMMSNSFQEIESDEDVEWKFARSQLWLSYLEKGATLPIPFNLVPSPKTFIYFHRWAQRQIKRWRQRQEEPPPMSHSGDIHMGDRRNGVFNIMNHTELRRVESAHESIMKGIVKRYLFKLQRDKENDEVNEGELDEIKNDISSLRFELLEEMKKERPASSLPQNVLSNGEHSTFSNDKARGTHEEGGNNVIMKEIDHKVQHMDNKIDTLSRQMDKFRREVLIALQTQCCNKRNDDVEYI